MLFARSELIVPPETTFKGCPSGYYRGTLHHVKESRNPSGKETVRLIFRLHTPKIKNKIFLAGRIYERTLAYGSQLRHDLETWLGKDYVDDRINQAWNWAPLYEREADLKIEHFKSPKHSEPFADVVMTLPPGTIVKNAPDLMIA